MQFLGVRRPCRVRLSPDDQSRRHRLLGLLGPVRHALRHAERLERAGVQGDLGPKLNEPKDPQVWLDEPGSPKAKLENEEPKGETVSYDELVKSWQ